jgi:probable rRNA maturation factor
MKIVLLDRQEKIKIDTLLLKKISSYIAGKFNRDKNAELNIVFVEKEEMSILNEKYHGDKGPTDVLSFSYCSQDTGLDMQEGMQIPVKELFDDVHGFTVAGEIIICPEVAEINAKKNNPKLFPGWSTLREIIVLIIHGILHIYDYDHASREERLKMESIQNSILNDVVSSFNV